MKRPGMRDRELAGLTDPDDPPEWACHCGARDWQWHPPGPQSEPSRNIFGPSRGRWRCGNCGPGRTTVIAGANS